MAIVREPQGSESALIHECLAGDKDAFESLYRRHFPLLVGFCRRRVGDHTDAEDLAQEAMLRAFVRLETFDTSRPLWPWLKAIAANLASDRLRARGREVPGSLPERIDSDAFAKFGEDDLLAKALARVPRRQRIALGLRYLEDWEVSEAAVFLGLDSTAFTQLLFRARRRFRLEYLRLTERDLSGILLPVQWIRRVIRRGGGRAREIVWRHNDAIGSGAASQWAAGLLAAALVAGGLASLPPTNGDPHRFVAPLGRATDVLPSQAGGSRLQHAAHRSERQIRKAPKQPPKETVGEIRELVFDPNRNVNRPHQVEVLSITFSPNFATDRTIFLVGYSRGIPPFGDNVLLRSTDGGDQWSPLRARGLVHDVLLLPPRFGESDDRIFSPGWQGLLVSEDGGESFHPASPASRFPLQYWAMSPGFNGRDPSILLYTLAFMRYRDESRLLEPYPLLGEESVLYAPVYSPSYPKDPRIFIIGGSNDPLKRRWVPILYTCTALICDERRFPRLNGGFDLLLPEDFPRTSLMYGWNGNHVLISVNEGKRFSPVSYPGPPGGSIRHVSLGPNGELWATVWPPKRRPWRLYVSMDRGASWSRIKHPLFSNGVLFAVAGEDRILVALKRIFGFPVMAGVACSTDGGVTWYRRCRS